MVYKRKRRRAIRLKSHVLQHKISVVSITCVIALLAVMLSVGSISLRAKNEAYIAQEAELEEQLQQEAERAAEIEELEDYVGTNEYIEGVAKEKLELINPNEILFKAEK